MTDFKITFDARMWSYSGIGTYIRNVAKFVLPEITMVKWTFLCFESDRTAIEKLNVVSEIIIVRSQPYSLLAQFELLRKIPSDSDFVWFPHWNVSWFTSIPMIVTIHDLFHSRLKEKLATLKQYLGSRPYFFAIKFKKCQILTVSDSSARALLKENFENVTTIKNFVSDVWVQKRISTLCSDEKYFIFVSNIKPHKNLITLLKAFESLLDELPDYKLLIVGQSEGLITSDKKALEWIDSLGERVVFLGMIPFENLIFKVQNAAALICPSFYEGFGLPVLEGMRAGTPVVASKISAHEEVGGDSILYFDPDDWQQCAAHMKLLASDGQLRSSLVQRGSERSADFSVENTTLQYVDFFKNLARPRTR